MQFLQVRNLGQLSFVGVAWGLLKLQSPEGLPRTGGAAPTRLMPTLLAAVTPLALVYPGLLTVSGCCGML